MGFSIDRNIRRLRKEAGLTQEELAQKLFVTRQTISLWELGKVHPDLETLQKLAEQFQVDLLQVLYGPEYTPAQQLLRRLPVWAGLSGGLALLLWGIMAMAEWSLVQPGMIATPAFFVVGNAYLWMSLYGRPLLWALSGAALGHVLTPVFSGKKRIWPALGGLLAVLMLLIYVVGISVGNIPWISMAAWELQQVPWVFLLAGIGLYGFGRILMRK